MRIGWLIMAFFAALLLVAGAGPGALAQGPREPAAAAHPTYPPPPPLDPKRKPFKTTLGTWRVKTLDAQSKTFTLRSEKGEERTFAADKAEVLRDGKQVELAKLQVGDSVTAKYDDSNSTHLVAVEITVRPDIRNWRGAVGGSVGRSARTAEPAGAPPPQPAAAPPPPRRN